MREQLKEAFELLPSGAKQEAANIYGCHYNYFKRIVDGEPKGEYPYKKAFSAVLNASNNATIKQNRQHEKIVLLNPK